MKEASGELSMTLITIIAVAAIAGAITIFWPMIRDTIKTKWGEFDTTPTPVLPDGYIVVK